MRGLCLSNSDNLRRIHNNFAKITISELCSIPEISTSRSSATKSNRSSKAIQNDAVFHFISYVPINGHVYQLDGLSNRSIRIGIFFLNFFFFFFFFFEF